MPRDFTLQRYKSLLSVVANSFYTSTMVWDYLTSPPERCLILRYDVDRAPRRALDMTRVEGEIGVQGNYYFSFMRGTDVCEICHFNRCVL